MLTDRLITFLRGNRAIDGAGLWIEEAGRKDEVNDFGEITITGVMTKDSIRRFYKE